ncbi:MAG: hypothetical protein R3F55_21785 [Alphaproteobacteria bacterium]
MRSDSDATANTISESVSDDAAVGITALASTRSDRHGDQQPDDDAVYCRHRRGTGVVTVADASLLDYETATSHTVTVQATSDARPRPDLHHLTDDTRRRSVRSDGDATANTISRAWRRARWITALGRHRR